MDRETIEKIEEMSKVEKFDFHGLPYTSKKLHRVEELRAETLRVSSLDSFCDLIVEHGIPDGYFVNVESPTQAVFYSKLRDDVCRDKYFICEANDYIQAIFNEWIPIEKMIIMLKSLFIPNEDRENLIKLLGNITDSKSVTTKDDGVTQTVTARTGIALEDNVAINPIVKLIPYRTFLEVEQPESEFLIRLRGDTAALFEADGGVWRVKAKKNIVEYLKAKVKEFNHEVLVTG